MTASRFKATATYRTATGVPSEWTGFVEAETFHEARKKAQYQFERSTKYKATDVSLSVDLAEAMA